MPNYLIIDLEMCKLGSKEKRKLKGLATEIIQIGAVIVDDKLSITDTFNTYVKPEFGEIDEYIENLTGITSKDTENAPKLMQAVQQFASWMGNRSVVMMSWSDTDYYQLMKEMKVKNIKFSKIDNLFAEWIDLQRTFDEMLDIKNQTSLDNALRITSLKLMGKAHNGLTDAYNTARLFIKLQTQKIFEMKLHVIAKESATVEHLEYSMGQFFNTNILEQFGLSRCEAEAAVSENKEDWEILKLVYKKFMGEELPNEINWKLYIFYHEMRREYIEKCWEKVFGEKCRDWK